MSHPIARRLAEAGSVLIVREATPQAARARIAEGRAAGLVAFEIALSTPSAIELIRDFAADPALVIGAGTVRTAAEAYACGEAGARFLVCPWNEPEIVPAGKRFGACVMLGALTPDEVVEALEGFADAVSVFPAPSLGGAAHIRALRTVFPEVAFYPSGGIAAAEAMAYRDGGAAFVGIDRIEA
ncbi:bifunctional 4-hydroxy-2-oxoglutarate aldolase/2-dehydro-3-deoxy-phosphogluconate aldolase [Elioraea thermophila]|uniref:bifunctional 4-hydroxy-2-oxoglutarate aldolase/2-dehydro-3-deoxy-phosphogluconate aldolase n=1 Tax=Elioraea thermophila TaxID=2185104 RepID=UPI000DF1E614|nr:2-dehydro-3-deoxyphosphogluconate aldolase [Elioraea thermophila]